MVGNKRELIKKAVICSLLLIMIITLSVSARPDAVVSSNISSNASSLHNIKTSPPDAKKNWNIYYVETKVAGDVEKVTTVALANLNKSDVLLSPPARPPLSKILTSPKNSDDMSGSSEKYPAPGEMKSEVIFDIFSRLTDSLKDRFNLD